MGQLATQIAENSSGGFGANIEKNPKTECKVVMTRSKRETMVSVVMVTCSLFTKEEREEVN